MKARVSSRQPFIVKDCALVPLATGLKAQNLREICQCIRTVAAASIEHHFWSIKLQPRFEDPEFNNDFAAWVRHALHDKALAERLGMIDPTAYGDVEQLRQELLDLVEEHLENVERIPWSDSDQQFYFVTSQIVIFNTHKVIHQPRALVSAVPSMTSSSIFYHFIDARRRTEDRSDDFRAWLYGFNDRHSALCERLSSVDPFFSTLPELRQQLTDLFRDYFGRPA